MTHLQRYKTKRYLHVLITSATCIALLYFSTNMFLAFVLGFLFSQLCLTFIIWPRVWTPSAEPSDASLRFHKRYAYILIAVLVILAGFVTLFFGKDSPSATSRQNASHYEQLTYGV